jgi:hypothetical protein
MNEIAVIVVFGHTSRLADLVERPIVGNCGDTFTDRQLPVMMLTFDLLGPAQGLSKGFSPT